MFNIMEILKNPMFAPGPGGDAMTPWAPGSVSDPATHLLQQRPAAGRDIPSVQPAHPRDVGGVLANLMGMDVGGYGGGEGAGDSFQDALKQYELMQQLTPQDAPFDPNMPSAQEPMPAGPPANPMAPGRPEPSKRIIDFLMGLR